MYKKKRNRQKLTPDRLAELQNSLNDPIYVNNAINCIAQVMAVNIRKREKEGNYGTVCK